MEDDMDIRGDGKKPLDKVIFLKISKKSLRPYKKPLKRRIFVFQVLKKKEKLKKP